MRSPGSALRSTTRRYVPDRDQRPTSSSPVALDFAGPPLALPGEDVLDDAGPWGPPALLLPPAPDPGGLLPELPPTAPVGRSSDGWARLRATESPVRVRSTRPPPASRDDALGLAARRPQSSAPGADLQAEMTGRFALGDFSGALRAAELLLGRAPEHAEARRTSIESRERLGAIHRARLGALFGVPPESLGARVPIVVVPTHEIRWLGLDHRQGFVLSRIDGATNLEDLADVAGVPELELLQALVELADLGAIDLAVR